MTKTDIRNSSRELAKTLAEAGGFKVGAWQDQPFFEEVPDGADFVLRLDEDRKKLIVYYGGENADVSYAANKRYNQVVLDVNEPARTITEEGGHRQTVYNKPTKAQLANPEQLVRAHVSIWSRMRLPEGTESTEQISDVVWTPNPDYVAGGYGSYGSFTYKVTFTHKVPASSQHFLVGRDEEHLFICLLPKACESVKEAHAALRPKGVTDKAIRQGEWFFEPTDEQFDEFEHDTYDLQSLTTGLDAQATYDMNEGAHIVSCTKTVCGTGKKANDRTYYVRGAVTNKRHKTLWLNKWHKVVRSLELEQPEGAENWD